MRCHQMTPDTLPEAMEALCDVQDSVRWPDLYFKTLTDESTENDLQGDNSSWVSLFRGSFTCLLDPDGVREDEESRQT